jgi:starch synthase
MNIVWICSEAAPYAKTGGLADVSASLPAALAGLGHNVSVVMPYYPQVMGDLCSDLSTCYEILDVPFFEWGERCAVRQDKKSDNLSYYFIEHQRYFDRPFLYDYYGKEYEDNAERFIFFSRAAMEAAVALKLDPDVLHTNDWHTGLCNIYLKSSIYCNSATFAKTKSVLTIHNIGYQGVFPKEVLYLSGLSWDNYNYTCLEYHDQVNFLKGGMMSADMVTTVSPTYADEILSSDFAFSLEDSLRHLKGENRLKGILNGIDTNEWSPDIDPLIPANFAIGDMSGKKKCRRALQKEFNLKQKPKVPILGLVSRFAYQKGIDVLSYVIEGLLINEDAQFVILGSGDDELESFFSSLAARFPGKIGVYIGYNNKLAHLIEAGSDMFMMPSRYEPCGLNQMYSMQYGTVPIVRSTGGLADTVINYSETNIAESTGFTFDLLNHDALLNTIKWALSVYHGKPANFAKLIENGMKQDFSWKHTASEYEEVYEGLAQKALT